MKENISKLLTEQPNLRTLNLDQKSVVEILKIMNEEDKLVPLAVSKILPTAAKFIEEGVKRLRQGGRIFYVGAGTSGRLGVLDAAECPPTFGTKPEMVQGIIAGGPKAVFTSIEGAEDQESEGVKQLKENRLSSQDCVVGLSASGRTPFVLGALKYATKVRALTAGITCNPNSKMSSCSDYLLVPWVGPEVISGSTRLKCGTAQKLILNMISTGMMVCLGRVKGNRMVDLLPKSKKLWERAKNLVCESLNVSGKKAETLLRDAGGSARKAIERGMRDVV